VSKTPARKPAKPSSAKKPAAKSKPAAKAPAKPAAKPATRPVAKPAPKAAKPTPKAAAKPVKPSAKPVAKAPAKPAPKAAEKPVAKAAPAAKPVPAPAPRPTVAGVEPAPLPRPSAKVAALRAASAAAPLPTPQATSRFADRFAPPRAPARGLPVPVLDVPKPMHKADPKLVNAWKSKSGRELTEAELLAMPDSEYMNEKQLEFFRARLQALKDDLLSNAGETTEHLREDTTIVPDPADRATIEEEHALELRTRDRERKLLKKISQSLARIDSGDYGFCDETGEPIGLGRLIARPTATLSLEAQQRREMKQKMFGD
jgi:DnaK suppressor protein